MTMYLSNFHTALSRLNNLFVQLAKVKSEEEVQDEIEFLEKLLGQTQLK